MGVYIPVAGTHLATSASVKVSTKSHSLSFCSRSNSWGSTITCTYTATHWRTASRACMLPVWSHLLLCVPLCHQTAQVNMQGAREQRKCLVSKCLQKFRAVQGALHALRGSATGFTSVLHTESSDATAERPQGCEAAKCLQAMAISVLHIPSMLSGRESP